MDVLQQTHAALNLLIKEPRNPTNPLRDHLERVTDATERAFTAAREAVRGCATLPRDASPAQATTVHPR
jgi:hypothetical protein